MRFKSNGICNSLVVWRKHKGKNLSLKYTLVKVSLNGTCYRGHLAGCLFSYLFLIYSFSCFFHPWQKRRMKMQRHEPPLPSPKLKSTQGGAFCYFLYHFFPNSNITHPRPRSKMMLQPTGQDHNHGPKATTLLAEPVWPSLRQGHIPPLTIPIKILDIKIFQIL